MRDLRLCRLVRSRSCWCCSILVLTLLPEEEDHGTGNGQQCDSYHRTVEDPCDGSHEQRPYEAHHRADDVDTEREDAAQERHHLEDGDEDAEDTLQTADDQQPFRPLMISKSPMMRKSQSHMLLA